MAFQLEGGNAASQDYDYQSGSGMDNFMSRSIDEVSWQSNLGSAYNSLSELPIGLLPTSSTPTNYDATQITGSQGGATTVGSSDGSGNSNGITINPSNNTISLNQGDITISG